MNKREGVSRRGVLNLGLKTAAVLGGGGAVLEWLAGSAYAEAPGAMEGEVINGVETHGHSQPLTQAQHDQLWAEKNSAAIPGDGSVYKGVWVIPDLNYTSVPAGTGDPNYQEYLRRQVAKMDELLRQTSPDYGGARLLWLERVEAGTYVYASDGWGWAVPEWRLKEVSGVEGMWYGQYPHRPWESSRWDSVNRIDWDGLHELGHKWRWPDIYIQGVNFVTSQVVRQPGGAEVVTNLPETAVRQMLTERHIWGGPRDGKGETTGEIVGSRVTEVPGPLLDIPSEWRWYYPARRNDNLGGGLMDEVGRYLDRQTDWYARRWIAQGRLYDPVAIRIAGYQASWVYAGDRPGENVLEVGPQYDGAAVKVYRMDTADGGYIKRTLNPTPVFAGEVAEGKVNIGDPFATARLTDEGNLPAHQAVLWVIFYDQTSGRAVAWRPMGYGDFQNPEALGLTPEEQPDVLIFRNFQMASGSLRQSELDWRVSYEKIIREKKRVYLPSIQR